MNNNTQLGYVIVYVENVVQTLEFYEQAFGLKRKFLHESKKYGQLATGETALAFADEQDAPVAGTFNLNRKQNKPAAVEIAFTVNDVETAYSHAVNMGAEATLAPTEKPWGQTVAYVRDCNGFLIELCTAIS